MPDKTGPDQDADVTADPSGQAPRDDQKEAARPGRTGDGSEAPEPPSATHGAEDETWETDGTDAPHLEDVVASLREQVLRLERELEEAKDRALRARADYDNLTRRTDTERQNLALQAAGRIVEQLLDPLEILKRAAADMEGLEDSHAQGVRLTYRTLRSALEREGIEEVPGVGSLFDVQVHEAIARDTAPEPEGTVIEVLRPGYRLHGRLLRPALVKVSSGPE